MAKKTAVKKTFPLLVLIDQDQHYAEKPYIARTHVKLALQTLQLISLHVKQGNATIDTLLQELDAMYSELSSPVALTEVE